MEHFFPPNSSGDPRSDAHQSQIIEEDADVDYTQIIGGGIQSNYCGIYPLRVSAPLSRLIVFMKVFIEGYNTVVWLQYLTCAKIKKNLSLASYLSC